MAPLAPSHVSDLIESCAQMIRERDRMAKVLSGMPESFAEVRTALNQLHRIIGSQRSGPV